MLKFDKEAKIASVRGALMLRPEIEKVAGEILAQGFDSIYFIGIGGTWASALQVECWMKGQSILPVYVENAAEYAAMGNRRITEKTVMVFSSVS